MKQTSAQRRERKRIARAYALAVRTLEKYAVKEMLAVYRQIHVNMLKELEPFLKELTEEAEKRTDAIFPKMKKKPKKMGLFVDAFVKHVEPWLLKLAVKVFNVLFNKLLKKDDTKTIQGIAYREQIKGIEKVVDGRRKEWLHYFEKANRAYAEDVKKVLTEDTIGLRYEVLKERLIERGNVSERRAELIARDQVLKLAGSINQERQKQAGIEKYVWNTSNDEAVRDTHEALEDSIQRWDSPPPPGHPGEDFQCRCVAIPYFGDEN